MKLSGWQRLVVVLFVLWTLGMGVQTWWVWPPSQSKFGTLRYPDESAQSWERRRQADLATRQQTLPAERALAAKQAVAWWLIPPVSMWGLWLAGRWVYLGFDDNVNKGHGALLKKLLSPVLLIVVGTALFVHGLTSFRGGSGSFDRRTGYSYTQTARAEIALGAGLVIVGLLRRRGH